MIGPCRAEKWKKIRTDHFGGVHSVYVDENMLWLKFDAFT